MSYATAASLQTAVFSALAADAALDGLLGPRGGVFDGLPMTKPEIFVALGPDDMTARADADGAVCRHELMLSVVTRGRGFLDAKRVAARVAELLDGAELTLTRGRLMDMRLRRARARIDEGEGVRRIDMWFRARSDEAED